MRRVVIRCDGGTHIGMGHVVRCSALAEMIRSEFEICFVLQETNSSILTLLQSEGYQTFVIPRTTDFEEDAFALKTLLKLGDIVLLDGYHFKTAYQRTIHSNGNKLVVIDDLHAWHHVADVIINHAAGVTDTDYDAEPYTQLLLGWKYVLLRAPFLKRTNPVRTIEKVRSVLISMGAADENNRTKFFVQILKKIKSITKINILLSDINPHKKIIEEISAQHPDKIILWSNLKARELHEMMTKNDLIICPASSISLEACSVGIGIISGYTAQNQLGISKGLESKQLVNTIGSINQLTTELATQKIEYFVNDIENLNRQIVNQSIQFDGESGERIKTMFKQL